MMSQATGGGIESCYANANFFIGERFVASLAARRIAAAVVGARAALLVALVVDGVVFTWRFRLQLVIVAHDVIAGSTRQQGHCQAQGRLQ